jgi:hypothetical protein
MHPPTPNRNMKIYRNFGKIYVITRPYAERTDRFVHSERRGGFPYHHNLLEFHHCIPTSHVSAMYQLYRQEPDPSPG